MMEDGVIDVDFKLVDLNSDGKKEILIFEWLVVKTHEIPKLTIISLM